MMKKDRLVRKNGGWSPIHNLGIVSIFLLISFKTTFLGTVKAKSV